MIAVTLAFTGGILLLQLVPQLPPGIAWGALPPALAGLCWRPARLPAIVVLGFLWAAWRAGLALAPQPAPALEGRTLHVEGRVIDLPRRLSGEDYRFLFAIERMDAGGGWRTYRATARLGWYRAPGAPRPGERWRLAVRLKRPHGYANPGGFDYERWLLQRRIHATGYVRADPDNRRLPGRRAHPVAALRAAIADRFDRLSPAADTLGLVRALAIGDRGALTPAQWDVLRATGTGHLMAISGLHITLVSGLVFLLARRAWARAGRLAERLPAPRVAAGAALAAGTFYALLAGFGIPTQRALVMLAAAMLAVLAGRAAQPLRVLCVAALAVLLLDPLAVLAPGWWLSFWAVALILYTTSARHGPAGLLRRWTWVHLLLAAGLLPLSLAWFQQASLVAPLANVIAVPWTGLVVVPIALAGAVLAPLSDTASGWLLGLAARLLAVPWPWLEWLAGLEFASLQRHAPLPWTLPPAVAGLLLLFAPRGIPGRWLGAVLLLPLCLARPDPPAEGEARVALLDVGQGLAVVVHTHRHVLVYDAGPAYGPAFDTGAAVVAPYLRHRGTRRIDTLVVSHGDNDHVGGVRSLLRGFPVDRLLVGDPEALAGRAVELCRRGDRWYRDGVEFAVLYPGEGPRPRGNNASCVLRVTSAGGHRLLVTGDIEAVAERNVLAHAGAQVAATVMTAPHHGSRTSSSPAFLRAVDPEYVLFPVGYRNRYRFPHERVLERYRAAGARTLDSARHGALLVRLPATAAAPVVTAWRCRQRRYWRPAECAE